MIPRITGLLAAVLLGALTFYNWVYEPFVCNLRHNDLEASTLFLKQVADDTRIAVMARENVRKARTLCAMCPTTVAFHQHLAENQYALALKEDALASYGLALTVDRRPEIHLARGNILVELGRIDEAVSNYVQAVKFYPALIDNVSSPYAARLVRERLAVPRR